MDKVSSFEPPISQVSLTKILLGYILIAIQGALTIVA